jgi:hypothetical protein
MTDKPLDDTQLIASLRALYDTEVQRAGRAPSVARAMSPGRRRNAGVLHLAMVVGVGTILVATAALSFAIAPRRAAESAASPGPSATPALGVGAIVDGIPISVDGQPVLRGQAIPLAIARATDASPFLVGGWLLPLRGLVCPQMTYGNSWSTCNRIGLRDDPKSGSATLIYPGNPPRTLPFAPGDAVQPIVLLIRTHDPSCAWAGAPPNCSVLPAVVRVAWVGPALSEFASTREQLLADPRARTCNATEANTRAIFVMANGAEIHRHFPTFGRAPELERETNAVFVVVYVDGYPGIVLTKPGSGPAPTNGPNHADICVVGWGGEMNIYGNVSLEGFVP